MPLAFASGWYLQGARGSRRGKGLRKLGRNLAFRVLRDVPHDPKIKVGQSTRISSIRQSTWVKSSISVIF